MSFFPSSLPPGLGNRLLAVVSVFLYSLLTNRTLLMPADGLMPSFLCEPFASTSWLMPADQFWWVPATTRREEE